MKNISIIATIVVLILFGGCKTNADTFNIDSENVTIHVADERKIPKIEKPVVNEEPASSSMTQGERFYDFKVLGDDTIILNNYIFVSHDRNTTSSLKYFDCNEEWCVSNNNDHFNLASLKSWGRAKKIDITDYVSIDYSIPFATQIDYTGPRTARMQTTYKITEYISSDEFRRLKFYITDDGRIRDDAGRVYSNEGFLLFIYHLLVVVVINIAGVSVADKTHDAFLSVGFILALPLLTGVRYQDLFLVGSLVIIIFDLVTSKEDDEVTKF